jgi:hypothetical protein
MSSIKLIALGACLALASSAFADASAAPAASTTPACGWTFNYGLSARAFYDTNVYQSGLGALGDQNSFGAAIGATIKATDKFANGSQLIFGYAPTGYLYTKNTNLDYLNQGFTAEEKFSLLDFNWDLNQSLVWVAGQTQMPIYNTDGNAAQFTPGFTAPAEQARTDQLVWGESFNVNRKFDKWLLEFVGNGVYQNFESDKNNAAAGYLNCTDRYDVNGGFNIGYNVWEKLYVLAGYRLGSQWQGINTVSASQFINYYNRALVGARGTVFDNLTFDFMVGPDFRNFTGTVPHGFPTSQPDWYYAGTATFTPTKADTFTGSFVRFNQMASTGANDYQDAITSIKYARQITPQWSADVALSMEQRSYLPDIGSTTQQYTLYYPTLGVNYAATKNLSYRAAWTWTSCQADTPSKATLADAQEFRENVFSVEADYKF